MIDSEIYLQIESLDHEVRGLNEDLSDLRQDVERYDDEHRAAVEKLTAQVRSLADAVNRLSHAMTATFDVSPSR